MFMFLNMFKTFDKYQKCSYGVVEVSKPTKVLESGYREYLKFKARYEALQRIERNFLGEDLGPLNSKELEQFERQLDSSLKHVYSIKVSFWPGFLYFCLGYCCLLFVPFCSGVLS